MSNSQRQLLIAVNLLDPWSKLAFESAARRDHGIVDIRPLLAALAAQDLPTTIIAVGRKLAWQSLVEYPEASLESGSFDYADGHRVGEFFLLSKVTSVLKHAMKIAYANRDKDATKISPAMILGAIAIKVLRHDECVLDRLSLHRPQNSMAKVRREFD